MNVKIKADNIIQKLCVIFAGLLGFFSSVEPYLVNDKFGPLTDKISFAILAVISSCFIVYFGISGRLYRKADVWIFFSLFVYSFIVSWIYYGFSIYLFASRFYYVWMIIVFLFVSARTIKNPDDLFRSFSFVYVISICILGIIIFVNATLTLKDVIPEANRFLGCFRVGRLCGMGNANTMAFHCMTCLLLSVYGFIKGDTKAKIFYVSAIVLLWFLIGLNNSRTVNITIAFTLAAFAFAAIRKKLMKKVNNPVIRFSIAAGAGIVTALLVIVVLMLPTVIYRGGVTAAAKISGNGQILDNVRLIYLREVADIDTLEDRGMIWKRSIELIFKNPRRTLFGVSVRGGEEVNGAYAGRHDIPMPFAHNMFLEIFRKLGLIGLYIWVVLLFVWGKNAIIKYFDVNNNIGVIYLMAAAAGILLTGMTELGPFPFSVATGVPYLFFLCCGRAMREDDC